MNPIEKEIMQIIQRNNIGTPDVPTTMADMWMRIQCQCTITDVYATVIDMVCAGVIEQTYHWYKGYPIPAYRIADNA